MNAAVTTVVVGKTKRAQIALLAVLFTIAYGLLLMMVVNQGKTIQSQRTLIHLLFKDNQHLKVKTAAAQTGAGRFYGHDLNKRAQAQAPSSQIPIIQVPPLQVSPDKANPRAGTKSDRKSRKAEKKLPVSPPAELTDPSDLRRVTFAI